MKIFLTIFLLAISTLLYANDTLNNKLKAIEQEIELTNNKINQIQQGQLTYQIEKDLLKETYRNNYDKINAIITIVLGIIGILGYLGIRDINSIKKEYQSELDKLKSIKNDFDAKSQNFDVEKSKFESNIKEIIKQNEEQNNKIRVLELKEKIKKLKEENQNYEAFEYCKIALEISPKDVTLWNQKGALCARIQQFEESKECFRKAIEIEPDRISSIANYVESLYFLNEIPEAKIIIDKHKKYFFEKENGNLIYFFNLIENFFIYDDESFKNYIQKESVNFENLDFKLKYFTNWSLKEAMFFAAYQPNSKKKTIIQNVLWYWDGQINAKTVAERLSIKTDA